MEQRRQGAAERQRPEAEPGRSGEGVWAGSQETAKTGRREEAGVRSDRRGQREGGRRTEREGGNIQDGHPDGGQEAPPGPRAVQRPLTPPPLRLWALRLWARHP